MVLESKRVEMEKLGAERKDLMAKRDGALTRFEQATAEDEKAKHKAAFDRFHARLQEIETRTQQLTADLGSQQGRMTGFERQLTTLQSEIQNLPADKAQAVADFVSNQKVIELNARLQGMQESMDRGPIDAVLAANRELAAKARVSDRIAGTDVHRQDQDYADATQKAGADEDFNAMLAARRAEREAKTGAQPAKKDSGLPEL
jgi:chromosome segregation ATPase